MCEMYIWLCCIVGFLFFPQNVSLSQAVLQESKNVSVCGGDFYCSADLSVHSIPCNDSVACADGSTCCKTLKGDWACCPLPQVHFSFNDLFSSPTGTL